MLISLYRIKNFFIIYIKVDFKMNFSDYTYFPISIGLISIIMQA